MTSQLNLGGVAKDYPVTTPDRAFRDAWEWDGPAVVIDWGKAVTNFRATATMPMYDFLEKALEANLITAAEMVEAAKGNWPASFDAAKPADATETAKAEALFARTTDVRRDAPLLALIVGAGLVTDVQLDAMFGYAGQYE